MLIMGVLFIVKLFYLFLNLKIRISLLNIFENLNKINEESCTSVKDYEENIQKLEKLKSDSQVI
jgi:hypothetical protein